MYTTINFNDFSFSTQNNSILLGIIALFSVHRLITSSVQFEQIGCGSLRWCTSIIFHLSLLISTVFKWNFEERPRGPNTFKDNSLQDLFDESPAQTFKEHSNSVVVDEPIVCRRWHATGKTIRRENGFHTKWLNMPFPSVPTSRIHCFPCKREGCDVLTLAMKSGSNTKISIPKSLGLAHNDTEAEYSLP